MRPVYEAINLAKSFGMHQHEGEIKPFAEWLQGRNLRNVLEIGSLRGGTMALWGCLSSGKMISLDLPSGPFGGAAHNLGSEAMWDRNERLREAFPHRYYSVLGDSHDPENVERVRFFLGEELVDFLFIDGDHSYEGVKQDFEMYSPLVREGGVIAFHDILDTELHRHAGCRVDRLWQELTGKYIQRVFSVDSSWGGIGAIVTNEFSFGQGTLATLHGTEQVFP